MLLISPVPLWFLIFVYELYMNYTWDIVNVLLLDLVFRNFMMMSFFFFFFMLDAWWVFSVSNFKTFSSEKFFSNCSLLWTSYYPDAGAILCGLSYFPSLRLLVLLSIFISAILIPIFKNTSECFSFDCALFLFQSCIPSITLRKLWIFFWSFLSASCLIFWIPFLRVFVMVSASDLEASLKQWWLWLSFCI